MKKYVILAICSFLLIIVQCTERTVKPIKAESSFKNNVPRISAGHGAIFNNGKQIVPDEKFIIQTQAIFISNLQENLKTNKSLSQKVDLIKKHVTDQVLKNALIIDVLLDSDNNSGQTIKKSEEVRLKIANNILRSFYVRQIQKDPIFPLKDKVWNKGLEDSIAAILERAGIRVSLATNASGEQYIEECRDALVPVPTNVFGDAGWQNLETFENEFIIGGSEAELWIYRSDDPPGVCLALPRYIGDRADALGIICMNTQNGNTCFFDNNPLIPLQRGQNYSIDSFIGGFDLSNGRCTDCHAGENPFIVHPFDLDDYKPFNGITGEVMPNRWYNPLVPLENPQGVWPQNPEPDFDLVTIEVGDRNCTSCHVQGNAGRFPTHFDEIPGYCGAVLNQAVAGHRNGLINPHGPTMPPPNSGELCEYAEQVNWLLRNCDRPEIEACPDFGFDEFILDCDLTILCDLYDEMRELPRIPVGCEVIDCCENCPYFDDYLDIDILWRSDILKSIQFKSITEKGEKITKTIFKDKPYTIRLKRSQKEFKNEIAFSPNSKEDYKTASKLIMEKKTDQVGKIIVVQLAGSKIASTQKLMIKVKK